MDRQQEISAGGVIYRQAEGEIQVALTQTSRGSMWCLPKGRVEVEETVEETALREVREETGLTGRIEQALHPIQYTYTIRDREGGRTSVAKTVHFFLMLYETGSTDDHDGEVVDVRWFPLDIAGRILHHAGERDVLVFAKRVLLGLDDGTPS